MQVENCFELGFIAKAHGIKGEVKVVFDVTDIYEYEDLESVYLLEKGKLTPFFVEFLRIQSDSQALVKFKQVIDRNQAEALKGVRLYLPLDQLPELDEHGFFYHDIIGYTIQDENLGTLGTIQRVMEMPAQDLLVMLYKGHEILIPLSTDVVLYPDKEKKLMFTRLPDGLIDVYTGN